MENELEVVAYGLEESVSRIRDKILRDGPYDGIAGFSQGSEMARLFSIITSEIDKESF